MDDTSSKWTVKQLKLKISELGFQPPSGLKKAELLLYYEGALRMITLNMKPTRSLTSLELKYTATKPKTNIEWKTHLYEYGWAVARVEKLNVVDIRTQLLDYLHECCPRFQVNDSKTWIRKNMPYNLHGIFKHWVGHLEPIWQVREACVEIFSKIWNCHDLLTSFDGFCLLTGHNKNGYKQWMHCDQSRSNVDFACVQGLVNLYPNGPDDGGTLLMEKSHEKFEEYLDRHPLDGIKAFFPIDPEDKTLKSCRIVKPILEEGDILLWDSRVFHCNLAPKTSQPRMCVYVSMMPKENASKAELTKRRKLLNEGRMTGHWCYGSNFSVNGKEPNPMYTHDTPKGITKIATMTPERLKLVC